MTFLLLTYHREVSLFHLLQQDLQRLQIQHYIVGFLQACPKQEQGLIHRGAEAGPHSRRSEMVTAALSVYGHPLPQERVFLKRRGPRKLRPHPGVSKGPAQPLPGGADTFLLEGGGVLIGPPTYPQ